MIRFSTAYRIAFALAVPAVLAAAAIVVTSRAETAPAPVAAQRTRSPAPTSSAVTPRKPQVEYTAGGKLLRPTGYRRWTYVGTPLTPNDMNGGQAAFPEFHSVYVNPKAYDQFAASGEFPDGTVVVKELVSVGAKAATSGKGYFMGDFIGLEVAIKDATRFQDEPGNWAYFSFGHAYPLKKQASPQATASCSACHGANADDDYVFTQYYPVLRDTKDSPNH